MSDATAQLPSMNEQVSEDVQAAVERTFMQMFAADAKATFRMVERDALPAGDVTAIIALTQKQPQGSLIVTFPQQTLFGLLKSFYKRDFTEVDKVAMGAVGEITNIIFGVFKYRLHQKGFSFGLAIPQIAAGAPKITNAKWILCGDFTSSAGKFHVLVARAQDGA